MKLRWAFCLLLLAAVSARAELGQAKADPAEALKQWRPFRNDPLDRLKTAAGEMDAHWADLRVSPIMDLRGRELGGKLDASLPYHAALILQGDVDVVGNRPELRSGLNFRNGAGVEAISKSMARPQINLRWPLGAKASVAARMDMQRSSAGASIQYAVSPLMSVGADVSRTLNDSRFMLRLLSLRY